MTVDPPQCQPFIRIDHGNPAMDAMTAPGQQLQTRPGGGRVGRLWQDPAAAGDDRVGGQDKGAGMAGHHRPRLFLGEAHGVRGRQLARLHNLVDIGGVDPVGLDPDLTKQVEPAPRGGSEHEERCRRHGLIAAGEAGKSR